MGNFDLALSYYAKVKGQEQPGSSIYEAVEYRTNYIYLIAGEVNELLDNTKSTKDPYLMTFRGYAYMKKMQWEDARASFTVSYTHLTLPTICSV